MEISPSKISIFYDSLCPVCQVEINFLRRVDRDQKVAFIDITEEGFNPEVYQRSMDDFVGTIHGIDSSGSLIKGMDVFREVYQAIGLGWLLRWTGLPLIRPVVDRLYEGFAFIRPKFSKFNPDCATGRCAVKH